MDRLAISGVVLALVAVIGGYAIEGGGISALFHFPAFIIVIGGSFGAVMLQTPSTYFVQGLKMFGSVWHKKPLDFKYAQHMIAHWADVSRQKGFLALEDGINENDDPFVRKGLGLLVDGVESDVLRTSLELDIELDSDRQYRSARIYDALGGYSPTIGIIGAVLGLIQAMANIDDPSALGHGIATAFVATIYGVGGANLFFIPVAQKLQSQIDNEVLYREMIVEGLLCAANGENPNSIERKLEAYSRVAV
ncbi:flagellar motor protein [Psychrosphaera haliotis]|uniref:Flagellar motor protein n=1 Tax=Psychrosphaera haliotis TaxID=555083 RepID=A0A6N8F7I2_9GAMM|nr:flagellar motor protein [Psychrosphaera haliotis]